MLLLQSASSALFLTGWKVRHEVMVGDEAAFGVAEVFGEALTEKIAV